MLILLGGILYIMLDWWDLNPLRQGVNLLGETSIESLDKTYDQVFRAGYLSCLLGVILEFGPALGDTMSLMREFKQFLGI